jgi:leader peptidase (prepilin peptidase)/N-methyltransferase
MYTINNCIANFGTPMFAMLLLPPLFAGILGLIFGSFFNVLIYRLPREESIVKPGSHCPNCNHMLSAWENIPVLSYVLLHRKCSACKKPISIRYPLFELFTGCCAIVLWYTVIVPHTAAPGELIIAILQALVLLFMIPVFVIDFQHYIIPELFTFTGIGLALAASFIPGGLSPLQSILGAVAGGGILWLLGILGTAIFKKGDAMGGGDMFLMMAIGALWGWKIALGTIGLGSLLGSIAGVSMMFSHTLKDDHRLPFGPFLIAGLIVSLCALDPLLTMYLTWVHNVISAR